MPKTTQDPPTRSDSTGAKKSVSRAYLREVRLVYRKRRVDNDAPVGEPLRGARQVVRLFRELENEAKEKLIVLCLDTKLKILSFEVVAIGAVDSVYVRPFEALRAAIALNAAGIVLVHNHPSGDPAPGTADREFTGRLLELTQAGGMELHDHVIIGDGGYYSFRERGELE